MAFNPGIHHRRSIRLRGYDYRATGTYFLTLCTFRRECIFGSVDSGDMRLNEQGELVKKAWLELPVHYPHVALDQFVMMPNHFHGVILLFDVDEGGDSVKRYGISEIVRGFKTFSARSINSLRNNHGCPVWQRNYYEHIVRNEGEMEVIRRYIVENPLKWETDENNPERNSGQV